MARRALAEHDQILAHWLHSELGVEGGHTVELCFFHACLFRNVAQCLWRQKAVSFLNPLQDRDRTALDLAVLLNDGINHAKIHQFPILSLILDLHLILFAAACHFGTPFLDDVKQWYALLNFSKPSA